MKLRWLSILVSMFFLTNLLMSKGVEVSEKIDFDIGTRQAILHGTAQGFETRSYKFYAKKGEILRVSLDSPLAHFNVYSPYKNSDDAAMYKGQIEGNHYKIKLRKSGTYTIQVYLTYEDAKKDAKTLYTLKINMQ